MLVSRERRILAALVWSMVRSSPIGRRMYRASINRYRELRAHLSSLRLVGPLSAGSCLAEAAGTVILHRRWWDRLRVQAHLRLTTPNSGRIIQRNTLEIAFQSSSWMATSRGCIVVACLRRHRGRGSQTRISIANAEM